MGPGSHRRERPTPSAWRAVAYPGRFNGARLSSPGKALITRRPNGSPTMRLQWGPALIAGKGRRRRWCHRLIGSTLQWGPALIAGKGLG